MRDSGRRFHIFRKANFTVEPAYVPVSHAASANCWPPNGRVHVLDDFFPTNVSYVTCRCCGEIEFHPTLQFDDGRSGGRKDVETLTVIALDVQEARDGRAPSVTQLENKGMA